MTLLQFDKGLHRDHRKLGVAIVGLGGAVATTAVAGALLIRRGLQDKVGLPLAEFTDLDLASYEELEFAGWDLYDKNLYEAALDHGVLTRTQLDAIQSELEAIVPWTPVSNKEFCSGVVTDGEDTKGTLRSQIDCIQAQLREFAQHGVDSVVMINLASTEHALDAQADLFQTAEEFEAGLAADDERISPAMLSAYAAITVGVPYGNFTPSTAADLPCMLELARHHGVPVAGKDGKTGQTFVKTVVAPAMRARALRVEGWFSTNILGNRDGEALRKPGSLQNKIDTKGSVLDSCLGYPVDNHIVQIHYYKPRGDNKEAWDNIDITGFLGHEMQLKINFLCKDSILAAPLVIEIARCLDFAHRKGERGAMDAMGVFFKLPMTADRTEPEHRFGTQQTTLIDWLRHLQQQPDVQEEVEIVEAKSA